MLEELNKRVKNLDTIDIGLIKWTVLFTGIVIVKIFPQLLSISYPLLVVIIVALAARPVYRFWGK